MGTPMQVLRSQKKVVTYGEGEKQQIRPRFAKERDDLLTKRRILIVEFTPL